MNSTAHAHDFKGTATAALNAADAVLAHWLPDGKHQGHEYQALNPTRADSKPGSFSINTTSGQWADFATGDKGSDLISLVHYLEGCGQGEAERLLADFLGIHSKKAVTPVTAHAETFKNSTLHPAGGVTTRVGVTGNTGNKPITGELLPKEPDMREQAKQVQEQARQIVEAYDNEARLFQEAERFLTLVDEEAGTFTFQTFDDDKQRKVGKLCRVLHGSLEQHWRELCRLNTEGAGVFVTINETDGTGRKEENITRVRAVFEEQDTANKAPAGYPIEPHIEVESSPGKFHRYWLADGLALDEYTGIQAGIAERYKGDPSAADGVNRVMRLPGFLHQKNPAQPHMVRMTQENGGLPYTAEKLRAAFPPVAGTTSKDKPKLGSEQSNVLKALDARGHLLKQSTNGGWDILCPWHEEHTTGDDGTAYWEPHTGGYKGHGFKCQHSHCTNRTADDLLVWLGIKSQPEADEWPAIIPLPERGDMGEAEPYRLDLLPDAIQTAAREVERFSMVPATSPAVIGLSVMAAAIGKKAVIVERDGLEHYPALFNAQIASSGERKSPPFKKMTYPLEQWAEEQQQNHEALVREAKANNEMIDVQAAALKNKAKKEGVNLGRMTAELAELESRRIQPPPFPSLFTTDTTEQRLFQKMHDRGGAYAVMSGEGRPVLDAIMGKYSGDGRTGDAVYLAGISGDTITRDRVGGDKGPEERVITRPCLNVCIMVQQGKYLEAASHPALRDSGALARIWPVWLPTMAGSRIERESDTGLNTKHLAAYNRMVREVLNHQPEKDTSGHTIPHKATLSPEAATARREFHNAIEQDMAEGKELADVRDIASKAVSQTCKLALVLHIAGNHAVLNKPDSVISLKTWATAQALGTYHLQEAIRVQRLADEDTSLEAARRVLRWICKEHLKEITATVLMQQGPRPRPAAAQARAVLEMLEERGYLKAYTPEGRRKPIYIVNPAYLATLASLAGGSSEK